MFNELCEQYPALPSSARDARRLLAAYLSDHHLDALVPEATLLVSELVTNSVLHARGPIDVHVGQTDGAVRVEVVDTGERMARLRAPGWGGRGLRIVAELSADWGAARLDGHRKTTWFELRLPDAPVAAP